MTADTFQRLWNRVAPAAVPLAHRLKWKFPERWFRIHSLPNSQRYAATEAEWGILLNRQLTILGDLFSEVEILVLVTGYYVSDNSTPLIQFTKEAFFFGLTFTSLEIIDLHQLEPEDNQPGLFYHPFVAEIKIDAPQIEPIVRAMANDELRAFFINPVSGFIIAPYDGGVDIISPNTDLRNQYRSKYRE